MLRNIQYYQWLYLALYFYMAFQIISFSYSFAILLIIIPIMMLFIPENIKIIGDTAFAFSTYFFLPKGVNFITTERYDHYLHFTDLYLGFQWIDPFVQVNQTHLITEVLSFSYLMFFLFLVFSVYFFGIRYPLHKKKFSSGFFFVYWCVFWGNLLLPSAGPYFVNPMNQVEIVGLFSRINKFIYDTCATKIDCIPSSHIGLSLYILFYSVLARKKLFFTLWLPICIGIVFATIYLRYHYIIDVIAGSCLAFIGITIAIFNKTPDEKQSIKVTVNSENTK